jgi:hypothetical protein
MPGSWRVIVAFAGVLALVFLVGLIGKFPAGRTACLLFAVGFLWISVLSFQRLRTGLRRGYFEARQFGPVNRADSPLIYWFYFSIYAVMLPIGLAIAIASAAAVYVDPFAH